MFFSTWKDRAPPLNTEGGLIRFAHEILSPIAFLDEPESTGDTS